MPEESSGTGHTVHWEPREYIQVWILRIPDEEGQNIKLEKEVCNDMRAILFNS